jgi:hypothetical protein
LSPSIIKINSRFSYKGEEKTECEITLAPTEPAKEGIQHVCSNIPEFKKEVKVFPTTGTGNLKSFIHHYQTQIFKKFTSMTLFSY